MATTFATGLATSNQAFTPPGGGVVGIREAVYNFTAALVVDDIIQMIPVAPGERVVDLQLIVETDLDSSTGVVIDVGDGVDPDRYIDGTTVGQAGGFASLGSGIVTAAAAAALNYNYTANDTIDVKIAVAPSGTPAASGSIRLRAFVVRG